MRAYEIHTFRDGVWKVDSVFHDREQAMSEAQKIDEGTRYAGVKVLEEKWDEASDQTTTRTLFRGGAAKNDLPAKPREVAKRTNSGHRNGTGKERSRSGKEKKSSFIVPIMVLVAIVVVACGALIGLQHLSVLK